MKDKYIKFLTYGLVLINVFIVYLIVDGIRQPYLFNEAKKAIYVNVIDKLKDIRNAQIAYRTVTNKYASNFDELIDFLDTSYFVLTQVRDSSFVKYDPVYRMDKNYEIKIIDTLGTVSVKDSLFNNDMAIIKALPYIPNTADKFEISSGVINKLGIKIPVFEVKVKKRLLLKDFDKNLVLQEEEAIDVEGKYVKIGSMDNSSISGNWSKLYESPKVNR